MWKYCQSTGQLFYGKVSIGIGYSGHGVDKNVPEAEGIKNMGPLPHGMYTIGFAEYNDHLGPLTMKLFPNAGNQMHDRGGFYIHGDSASHPGEASEGCIVLSHDIRNLINMGANRGLEVVP